ncbi:unnamed protein product [Prunus brigantina]
MFFETSQNTTYTFNNYLPLLILSVLRDIPLRNVAPTSWGMGLLLVFSSEDNGKAIVDKSNKLFSSSSSSSPSPCSSSSSSSSSKTCIIFERTNSNNLLLSKAQSTISICALLVFITLLLFTLSTFEPTTKPHPLITTASIYKISLPKISTHHQHRYQIT